MAILPNGTIVRILPTTIARSRLLRTVCDNAEPCMDAPVDINAEAFQEWLQHVQPGMQNVATSFSSVATACADIFLTKQAPFAVMLPQCTSCIKVMFSRDVTSTDIGMTSQLRSVVMQSHACTNICFQRSCLDVRASLPDHTAVKQVRHARQKSASAKPHLKEQGCEYYVCQQRTCLQPGIDMEKVWKVDLWSHHRTDKIH